MAIAGDLVRVRRGVYYRGKPTRFGMTRPSILEAAVAVAGPGSGPAGVAAAHMLGLTTQVPGTVEVGAPGKVPEPMEGVRFRLRPFGRRELRLGPVEVAVLEILRDPGSVEASWAETRQRFAELLGCNNPGSAASPPVGHGRALIRACRTINSQTSRHH